MKSVEIKVQQGPGTVQKLQGSGSLFEAYPLLRNYIESFFLSSL